MTSWEANWARYLNHLIRVGKCVSWKFESETFSLTNGTRKVFYTPDFLVVLVGGRVERHEVKGFLDDRSAMKLRLMAAQHPDSPITLIDKPAYRSIEAEVRSLIQTWERQR